MKNDITEHERLFAHFEPLSLRSRLNYFQDYTRHFPSITLFEITSFFRGSVYYLIVPFVALLLFFLQYFQSFFGVLLLTIGIAIFSNTPLPLPDSIKRVSLPSSSVALFIRFLQKIPRLSLSAQAYVWLSKICGIALFFLGIQLLLLPDALNGVTCALLLITSGMLVDQYFATIMGFCVVIYNFM